MALTFFKNSSGIKVFKSVFELDIILKLIILTLTSNLNFMGIMVRSSKIPTYIRKGALVI